MILLSHDHQFNWWFGDAPERGGLLAPPKGGVESTILAASQGGYFSVLLSFLDSSSLTLSSATDLSTTKGDLLLSADFMMLGI